MASYLEVDIDQTNTLCGHNAKILNFECGH